MSHMVVTTMTWFIWCQISHPQAGIRTDQPWHTQPGPDRPPLAKIGPGRARLLKLAPAALHCLLNLVLDSCLIIGSRGSGAALVRDGRGRTDVLVLIVMSVVATVLSRDGPSPPSVRLIVATCPTQ